MSRAADADGGAAARLTLVIHAIAPGGAEKVLSIMANHWERSGRRVTVISFDDGSEPPFYALEPGVQRVPLGMAGASRGFFDALRNALRRVARLRAAIRASRPDVVVSLLDQVNVTTLLATRGLGVPVVVCEHTDPNVYDIGAVWSMLRRVTYRWADLVVVLNRRARDYFGAALQERIRIIPNPVQVDPRAAPAARDGGRRRIYAMGRFTAEKRFDLLLRAFARIKDRNPDWDLTIFGDGPLRRDLEILAEALGLDGRIDLPGVVADPHPRMRSGDLYVSASRIEGFPCALTEAMACGLPVISTYYHSGVEDIITDGIDGVLVTSGDEAALTEAMQQLIDDPARRRRLGEQARRITDRYGTDAIMAMWDDGLVEAGARRPRGG
jgi:glycosyltransferase involved in cell wall biosynthesis